MSISPELEAIVRACLEKKRDRRPQSALELRRLLDSCSVEAWDSDQARQWWLDHQSAFETHGTLYRVRSEVTTVFYVAALVLRKDPRRQCSSARSAMPKTCTRTDAEASPIGAVPPANMDAPLACDSFRAPERFLRARREMGHLLGDGRRAGYAWPSAVLRGVCRFMVASSSVVLAGACGSSKGLSPSAAELDAAGVFNRGTAGPGPTPCPSLEGARCPGPPDAAVSADGGSGAAPDADAAAHDGGVALDAAQADTHPADSALAELTADVMGSPDASTALDAGAQDAGLLDASTDGTSTCQLLGTATPGCGAGTSAYAFSLYPLPLPLRAGQGYAFGVHIWSNGGFFVGNVVVTLGSSTDGCTVSAPLAQWTFTGTDIMETVCVKPQQDLTQVIETRSAASVGLDSNEFTYCGPVSDGALDRRGRCARGGPRRRDHLVNLSRSEPWRCAAGRPIRR